MNAAQKAQQLRCAAIAIRFAEEYLSKAQDQLWKMRQNRLPPASHAIAMRYRAKADAAQEIALFLEEQARQTTPTVKSRDGGER